MLSRLIRLHSEFVSYFESRPLATIFLGIPTYVLGIAIAFFATVLPSLALAFHLTIVTPGDTSTMEAAAFIWMFLLGFFGTSHFAYVSLRSLHFALFRAPEDKRLLSSVEALSALTIMFALAHFTLSFFSPEAYSGINASVRNHRFWFDALELSNVDFEALVGFLYFSVVTFTTVGFGDISPTTMPARLLTMAQMIAGFGIIVLVISRIGGKAADD